MCNVNASCIAFRLLVMMLQSMLWLFGWVGISSALIATNTHSHRRIQLYSTTSSSPCSNQFTQSQQKTLRSTLSILVSAALLTSNSWSVSALEPLPPLPPELKMGSAPVAQSNVVKLSDGVEFYDVVLGDGDEAQEGRSVQFLWVLRRSNGYFVASSASDFGNEPFIYRVGNREKVITGIDEAIQGMRVGGIRRISVPPGAAFVGGVDENSPGPLPKDYGPLRQILTRKDKEVWKFEIKLLKVKSDVPSRSL